MPRGERCAVRAQIQHGTGHLFDSADPPDRVHRCRIVGLARVGFIGTPKHIGINHRRTHRIHADFFLRILNRRRFRQPDDRVL